MQWCYSVERFGAWPSAGSRRIQTTAGTVQRPSLVPMGKKTSEYSVYQTRVIEIASYLLSSINTEIGWTSQTSATTRSKSRSLEGTGSHSQTLSRMPSQRSKATVFFSQFPKKHHFREGHFMWLVLAWSKGGTPRCGQRYQAQRRAVLT